MNEYNAAKNKKSLQKPEEPPLRMLLIPANSSATAVKIFSTLPQVEENTSGHLSSSRQQQFFNVLPEDATFTRQTYLQAAETLGIPVPSAERYINSWVSSGVIDKVGHGEFRKG